MKKILIAVIAVVIAVIGMNFYTTNTGYDSNNEEKIFDSDKNLEYGY